MISQVQWLLVFQGSNCPHLQGSTTEQTNLSMHTDHLDISKPCKEQQKPNFFNDKLFSIYQPFDV